jgi:hypothetical protein
MLIDDGSDGSVVGAGCGSSTGTSGSSRRLLKK